MTVLLTAMVWNTILATLGWLGWWRAPAVVLNGQTQPANATYTTDVALKMSSQLMKSFIDGFGSRNGKVLSYEALKESHFYQQDCKVEFYGLLQQMRPTELEANSRKAFFINVYNILTIDAILSLPNLPSSTISVPQFWRRYAYRIGPHTLTLDQIEHGILRGNRAHPDGTVFFKGPDDPHSSLTLSPDHRIHSALNCGAMSCPPLRAYMEEDLEQQLDSSMLNLCNEGVQIKPDGSLVINSIFKWYGSDFAPDERQVLEWLATCVQDHAVKGALSEAAAGKKGYAFEYIWDLNNVQK